MNKMRGMLPSVCKMIKAQNFGATSIKLCFIRSLWF